MGLIVSCHAAWTSLNEYMLFSPKKKKGTLWKLVTKKGVNEVDRLSRARPTNIHEEGHEKRREYPQSIDDQKSLKPMIANPLKDGLF